MTHNHLVPGSSPGGTTLKPSKSLTMRVFVFKDFSEPICEPKTIFLTYVNKLKFNIYEIIFQFGKLKVIKVKKTPSNWKGTTKLN